MSDHIEWLICELFRELNDWPRIIDLATDQQRYREKQASTLKRARDTTNGLHHDAAMWIELKEQLRYANFVL